VRRRHALLLPCVLALLTGCGNSRTPVPNLVKPAAADGTRTLTYRKAGLSFRVPRRWSVASQQAPLVTVVSSGPAVVAVWRYPRSQAVPTTAAELARARRSLVAAVRARQPALQVIRASIARAGGTGAIELDAVERTTGQPRRVRSVHVFGYGAEVVLEESAPAGVFHAVDHDVFSPLTQSLTVSPAS
jgi:hypothetical protein